MDKTDLPNKISTTPYSAPSGVFVASNATVLGHVEIGSQSSVWYGSVLRGDINYIKIGERTNIQDLSVH